MLSVDVERDERTWHNPCRDDQSSGRLGLPVCSFINQRFRLLKLQATATEATTVLFLCTAESERACVRGVFACEEASRQRSRLTVCTVLRTSVPRPATLLSVRFWLYPVSKRQEDGLTAS